MGKELVINYVIKCRVKTVQMPFLIQLKPCIVFK